MKKVDVNQEFPTLSTYTPMGKFIAQLQQIHFEA